jgi:hypothetical protein
MMCNIKSIWKQLTDLRNENSLSYRIALPIMQVIVLILLTFALIFNNTSLEFISDIFRDISFAIQILILYIFGIKELLIKKNKFNAYLCFGSGVVAIIFIIYIKIFIA